MTEKELNWKVVYVASRFEKKVAAGLTKENIEHYLPLVEKIRVWSDRKKKVQMPLFNSYVFVKPDLHNRDQVLNIPGVVKYLRYNNQDAIVTDAEINLIKSIIEKGYDISEYSELGEMIAGEAIQITQGPLKDYKGEILRIGNNDFALINFEQFGTSYKVQLPKQILKRIVK
jgi:transcription termination/antitermination protein NusG